MILVVDGTPGNDEKNITLPGALTLESKISNFNFGVIKIF